MKRVLMIVNVPVPESCSLFIIVFCSPNLSRTFEMLYCTFSAGSSYPFSSGLHTILHGMWSHHLFLFFICLFKALNILFTLECVLVFITPIFVTDLIIKSIIFFQFACPFDSSIFCISTLLIEYSLSLTSL